MIHRATMVDRNSNSLVDLPEVVNKSLNDLAPHIREFDIIAVQGMSGVVVGSPVSLMLKKRLVIVRKPSDDTHSYSPIVGINEVKGKRVLFLDDFRASGDTAYRVTKHIMDAGGTVVANYFYHKNRRPDTEERGLYEQL